MKKTIYLLLHADNKNTDITRRLFLMLSTKNAPQSLYCQYFLRLFCLPVVRLQAQRQSFFSSITCLPR